MDEIFCMWNNIAYPIVTTVLGVGMLGLVGALTRELKRNRQLQEAIRTLRERPQ